MDHGKILLPPTEYGSRKNSATTPPPTESIRAKFGLPPPPQWMLARTPMLRVILWTSGVCGRETGLVERVWTLRPGHGKLISLHCSGLNHRLLQLGEDVLVEELDERITENEVRIAIERGKNGKAAGPDCLTNEWMKDCLNVLLVAFTGLFNYCFDNACCPLVWNTSYLLTLYKGKGDISNRHIE